jgi:hypothetical protein
MLIILIILALIFFGGIGPWAPGGYGYGYGHAGVGIPGIILIVVVLLVLFGRL